MIHPLSLSNSTSSHSEPKGGVAEIRASSNMPSLELPDASFLLEGEYARAGQDLIITSPIGAVVRVEGYFSLPHPPQLVLANGSGITFDTVKALIATDQMPVLVAGPTVATSGGGEAQAVGKIESVVGDVEARGKDGVVRHMKDGDPIQEGDQVSTAKGGLAKLVFKDGTVFQVAEASRALINEYMFNPSEGKGQFTVTVLAGAFRYASGEIGHVHEGRHSTIKTPTATIGIRGSELMGEVDPTGGTTVVHKTGTLEISDILGKGMVTLTQPGMATAVRFGGGAPQAIFQAPAQLIQHFENKVSSQSITKAKELETLKKANDPDHTNKDGAKPANEGDQHDKEGGKKDGHDAQSSDGHSANKAADGEAHDGKDGKDGKDDTHAAKGDKVDKAGADASPAKDSALSQVSSDTGAAGKAGTDAGPSKDSALSLVPSDPGAVGKTGADVKVGADVSSVKDSALSLVPADPASVGKAGVKTILVQGSPLSSATPGAPGVDQQPVMQPVAPPTNLHVQDIKAMLYPTASLLSTSYNSYTLPVSNANNPTASQSYNNQQSVITTNTLQDSSI
ncbi:MAG: FecR domain-containing protein, partial [Magnetococcales bacterium]|nr:FecR domain-containing protein [Magnetococcales bacterium]